LLGFASQTFGNLFIPEEIKINFTFIAFQFYEK